LNRRDPKQHVRAQTTSDWFRTFDERLWLKDDAVGREEAAFIRKALRLRKGREVLDCPCGAGRIAFHLGAAGCAVTGVDRYGKFLARARRRFAAARLPARFLRADMRKITFDKEFDAAFNWGGSFGYFSDEENLEVLRRLARALRPAGRLLIDQPNRQSLLRNFRARTDLGKVVVRPTYDPKTQRINAVWSFKERGGTARSTSSIRLYTLSEFRRMFRLAGLMLLATHGGPDGSKYSRGSHRLVVVGRKV
jgi:SAM-dependent methyltransferase